MKKTIFAVAILTISMISTAWGQEQRRAPKPLGSTAMGGGSGVGVKNRKPQNLGDTATHEVGHVAGRTKSRATRTETVDNNETLRKRQPQGNTQNLLPYMEQNNLRKSRSMRKPRN